MFLSQSLLLVAIAALELVVADPPLTCTNLLTLKTCNHWEAVGNSSFITATCGDSNGNPVTSKLDLNLCMGNFKSVLNSDSTCLQA